jgi:tetratricopeptide (TPR) repeat protein
VCLLQLGRYDEAVASCRTALALDPTYYFAVGVMCQALINDGRLVEANATIKKYFQGVPSDDPNYVPIRRLAGRCRDLVEREARLADVLSGKAQVTPLQRRQLAAVCLLKKRYGDAVRLFDESFAAQPPPAGELQADVRFEAACAAIGAAEQSDDLAERARLLDKAMKWMGADLTMWVQVLNGGKESDRKYLLKTVYLWRSEPRLASIRDAEALRRWPPELQAQCRALWHDVNALIALAEAAAPQPE